MTDHEAGLTTKVSPWSVPETVGRLLAVIAARGMNVVAVIDLSDDAGRAGFTVRETTLVLFSDAAVCSAVMREKPLSALDFPFKALVWADAPATRVTYLAPAGFAARYGLAPELVTTISCVDDIVDRAIDR